MDAIKRPSVSTWGMGSLEILPLSGIKENPHNAREHDPKQLVKLRRSIEKFGFLVPVIIDECNQLLSGHARVAAARQLGLVNIPVVRARHLSESDKRAFILADNRLAELASWNKEALRRELSFLSDFDVDFDFSAIGFDTAEVDFIVDGADQPADPADAVPMVGDAPAVSRLGELWLMGEHRLFCGSALEVLSYRTLLPGEKARMVIADPPYNVPIDGHAGGRGAVKHREFAMASGEMTDDQYVDFLETTVRQIAVSVSDGSICFLFMDWRHTEQLLKAAKALTLKNICVWVKNNGAMGSLYHRSQHEFVFVFKCGAANHINNIELGKHGRSRTNVWEYRGINSFGTDRTRLLQSPTVKPVALVADAIRDCSNCGDLILDPFAGSGTTVIAAEKTKRRAALIEIDPLYVDVIIRRWQSYTGAAAMLADTGETFSKREHPPVKAQHENEGS